MANFPADFECRTAAETVARRIVNAQRLALPFPVEDRAGFYMHLFPQEIRPLLEHMLESGGPAVGMFMQAGLAETPTQLRMHNVSVILHVGSRRAKPAQVIVPQLGNAFWFNAPRAFSTFGVYADRHGLNDLYALPPDHPYAAVTTDWVKKALVIEDEVQKFLSETSDAARRLGTWPNFRKHWPEMASLMRTEPNAHAFVKSGAAHKTNPVSGTLREMFDMFHAQSLVANQLPTAWVNHYNEADYNG